MGNVQLSLLDNRLTEDAGRSLMFHWDQTGWWYGVSPKDGEEPRVLRHVRVQSDDGSGWKDIYVGLARGPYLILDGGRCKITDAFRIRCENTFTDDGATLASPYCEPIRLAKPAAPRDLSVRYDDPNEDNYLYLQWEHDYQSATHFAVQHRLSGSDEWKDAASGTSWRAAATTYTGPFGDRVKYYEMLSDGLEYDFRVRAEVRLDDPRQEVYGKSFSRGFGPAVDGPVVASVWVTLFGVLNPALAPTRVNALPVAPEEPDGLPTIRVEWEDNRTHDHGTGYLVERRLVNGGDWREVGRVPGEATTFHDPHAEPDVDYIYRITAMQDGTPLAGTRTEDRHDVRASHYVHLTSEPAAGHDIFRDGPFVMRTIEMNNPHAYVVTEFAVDIQFNSTLARPGDWARVRATTNGDFTYEKHVWIDADGVTQRTEERYGYPQYSEPCECKGQPPHYRFLYPTQSDDVEIRIEGVTNTAARAVVR